ncbi:hypothetical protein DV737_g4893, partial [Chaetothyriales sp. CBS 132003]
MASDVSTEKAGEQTAHQSNNQTAVEDPEKLQQQTKEQPGRISSESTGEALEPPKAPVNPWADPSSFPDGGKEAWMTVAGAAACFFVSWGWINCIGVFLDYYIRVPLAEYSASEVSWIPSLEAFFMLITGPVAGYLYDQHGPRWVLLIGSFMHVFGLMMASISHSYYQLLLSQGVCSAIGASFIFTPAVSCISTWFFRKRGMAIGLAASGSSLGGVLFPIMISRMIPEIGFGWAMRTAAFLILGLMIFANLTLKSRFPPSKRPFKFMAFVQPMKEVPMILLLLAAFFFYWGMFPVFSFITAVANGRGMSLQLSQYLVSVLNAGSIFGRTLPGILGDKIGRFNVMTVFCFLSAILVVALWIPTSNNIGELFFAPLFGFASGAAISLTPALIAQISPIHEIGTRTGLAFGVGSIGALTGSPIGGELISQDNGKYLYLQIFSGVVSFAGAAMFLVTRIYIGGVKVMKKV